MDTGSDGLGVKPTDISYSEKEVKSKVFGLERRGDFSASYPGAEPLRITVSGSPLPLKL